MGNQNEINEIEMRLMRAGVRPSPTRIMTLRILMNSKRPLSAQEIENNLDTVDRSSITRTLPVLVQAHLIHQISDGSGSMKYEACRDSNETHQHEDEHPHFHCTKCGTTICLDKIKIPRVILPEGYKGENTSYIISGLCPHCLH